MGSSRVIDAEAHTSIRRPVAVVFRWLTDPALVPLWVTGLVASQPVGGADRGNVPSVAAPRLRHHAAVGDRHRRLSRRGM